VAPRHVGEVTGAQEARGRPLSTPSHPSRAARTPVRERGHNFWGRGHNFKRQYLRTARTVCHDSKLERRLKTPREGIVPSPRSGRLRHKHRPIVPTPLQKEAAVTDRNMVMCHNILPLFSSLTFVNCPPRHKIARVSRARDRENPSPTISGTPFITDGRVLSAAPQTPTAARR
jgi:hypothetical protein